MKILLSNDDGYFAEGIVTLALALAEEHDVRVSAPAARKNRQERGRDSPFVSMAKSSGREKGSPCPPVKDSSRQQASIVPYRARSCSHIFFLPKTRIQKIPPRRASLTARLFARAAAKRVCAAIYSFGIHYTEKYGKNAVVFCP